MSNKQQYGMTLVGWAVAFLMLIFLIMQGFSANDLKRERDIWWQKAAFCSSHFERIPEGQKDG